MTYEVETYGACTKTISLGGRLFRSAQNRKKEHIILKPMLSYQCALSEVFHSKIAEELNQPTVKNKLAQFYSTLFEENEKGIASTIFTEPYEKFTGFDSVKKYEMSNENLYYPDEKSLQFRNLKLEPFVTNKLNSKSKEFIDDFLKVWLTGVLFSISDQKKGNNVGIIKGIKTDGTFIQRISPNHDFEHSGHFFPEKAESFENSPNKENIEFLKTNYKELIDEYFDNMQKLKCKLPLFCDFSGLEDFLLGKGFLGEIVYGKIKNTEKAHEKLSKLSESVHKSFNARIDKMLNTY